MKKLLTIAVMAGAMSAMAVESSNTFGILRVTIPAGQKTVIVSAPWIDAGSDGEAIKVKDLIKTANLKVATKADNGQSNADGDKIYVYNGTTYTAAFQLEEVDGVTKWNGINMVVTGSDTTSGGDESTTINRGDAVILDMYTAPNETKDIYLYGQYKVPPTSTTVNEGMTLIAAPMTEDLDLNAATWNTVNDGDMIYVRNAANAISPILILTYRDNKWGYSTRGQWKIDRSTIPAGEGFWYVRSKDAGQMTITWKSSN